MVDKNVGGSHTGVDKFVADLTNPGYYAGAITKIAQPLIKKGVQNSGEYLLSKAEPYLLGEKKIPMTGYKPKQEFWNPFKKENKFIPNSESYYRVIGDESGYNDLINSGIVRPNQNGIFSGRSTYYTKGAINDINNPVIGGGVKKGTAYKGGYIVEINKNNTHFPTQEHGLNKDWNFGITKPGDEIPYSSDYLNVYKRSGKNYIKLEKQQVPFKSEINWGNWNKEIPSNKHLMDEYLHIEKTAKQNGTWMKNSDGSAFKGTPEQFIQQNSSNFKKAFPNIIKNNEGNPQINYHGTTSKLEGDFFDESKFKRGSMGKGIYTSPNKDLVSEYIGDKGNLYNLYLNSKSTKDLSNQTYNFIEALNNKIDRASGFPYNSPIRNRMESNVNNLENSLRNKMSKYIDSHDAVISGDETVTKFSNYPKSAIGNNGMFDMLNPNIYKAIIPSAGLYGLTQSKK